MKKNEIYPGNNELLVVHIDNQAEGMQYWRVAVPNNEEIKQKILNECHTVPYSAHFGVQCKLTKLRQKFFLKGQTNDVRDFVSSCLICQTEKSDHTLYKGQLQNPELPVQKWQEVSIDFVKDLPAVNSSDSITTVINKGYADDSPHPLRQNCDSSTNCTIFFQNRS